MKGKPALFNRKLLCCAASLAVALSMSVPMPAAYAAGAAARSLHPLGGIDDLGDVVLVSGTDGMTQLAKEVAGGNTYAGKSVKLISDLDFEDYGNWTPIGSKEHPFCGSFCGYSTTSSHEDKAVRKISGLTVTGSSYLGLFGYIGVGGSVGYISMEDSRITATSSSEVIRNVGSIAGYVYGAVGEDEKAVHSCTSSATVTVTSTMKPDVSKYVENVAPDADIASGTSDEHCTFEYIGGLVGYCAGNMSEDVFSGSLSVTTHAAPASESKASLGRSVGGVVGQAGGYTTSETLNSDGEVTIKPHYPSASGDDVTTPDSTSLISLCKNVGDVRIVVDGESGRDRFGETTKATMKSAGGIAGYAMASFFGCDNSGDVNAASGSKPGGGDGVGGICGNLRSIVFSGSSSALSDAATYKAKGADESERLSGPELTVSDCSNSGQIIGLHAPGGICGGTGTYTTITRCANLENGDVAGTRWNKPMVGGICGQAYGSISYCYNRATVSSGISGTGGGYYVAGILGCDYAYVSEPKKAETFNSLTPQIYACYSTGAVLTGGSYKQGGICGENEGYIHDCYFLYDQVAHVSNLGNDVAVAVDYGTTDSKTVVGLRDDTDESGTVTTSAADKMKSKAYVAKLNACATINDFQDGNHFVNAADENQNGGMPVLASERDEGATVIDESKLSVAGSSQASYSATSNPMPAIALSYNGKGLVQGADFYAVPDSQALDAAGKCKDVSKLDGTALQAGIVGIGDYSTGGSATSWTAPYTMARTDFSSCTVTIKSKVFNFLPQYPATPSDDATSEVQIMDASGERVPASSFEMAADPGNLINYHQSMTKEEKDENDGKFYKGYLIKFTAKEDSNYTGNVKGIFYITRASLIDSDKAAIESITWKGMSWQFRWGSVSGGGKTETGPYRVVNGTEVTGMSIPYCGESIKPVINGYTYKDSNGSTHNLVFEKDYRLVYGDPGDASSLIGSDTASPNLNVGGTSSKIGSRPCMTLRYVGNATTNFQNYHNVFFTITKADLAKDCTISIPSTIAYKQSKKVVVKGYTGKKLAASNYSVSWKKLSNGKYRITIKGKNNLEGSVTKVVKGANTMKVSPSVKKLKRGASFKIKVKKAKGKVTYKSKSKFVKVSKKGKVTLSKKARKGKRYKVVVKAAGKGGYRAASKTVKIKAR